MTSVDAGEGVLMTGFGRTFLEEWFPAVMFVTGSEVTGKCQRPCGRTVILVNGIFALGFSFSMGLCRWPVL